MTIKDQNQTNNLSLGIVASVCALAVAVGGGIALWTNLQSTTTKTSDNSQTLITPPTSTSPDETLPPPLPATVESPDSITLDVPQPEPVTEKTVELYWVKDTTGEIDLISSRVKLETADEPEAILKAAFERLLVGPANTDVFSAIPTGTKVQALAVENNGVYIDLSEEFTSGGGSASMMSRLGQVIYTASSLEPDVKVWIFVGGKPLTVLGGEGLEVSQPITRNNFQQEFQF